MSDTSFNIWIDWKKDDMPWNEICVKVLEVFGLPGHRYITASTCARTMPSICSFKVRLLNAAPLDLPTHPPPPPHIPSPSHTPSTLHPPLVCHCQILVWTLHAPTASAGVLSVWRRRWGMMPRCFFCEHADNTIQRVLTLLMHNRTTHQLARPRTLEKMKFTNKTLLNKGINVVLLVHSTFGCKQGCHICTNTISVNQMAGPGSTPRSTSERTRLQT